MYAHIFMRYMNILAHIVVRDGYGTTTLSHYKSNTRVLSYELPSGTDETLAAAEVTIVDELRNPAFSVNDSQPPAAIYEHYTI